jgi:FlaA1/EpsC-like NDP-sugar epimerase
MNIPFFENQRILITGCCGTVGSELVRQLLNEECYSPLEVVGIDNNESALFFLEQQYLDDNRVRFFLGDIRDEQDLTRKFKGIDVVLHAAAFKHVIVCERVPDQVVQTNILGVQNVISAAQFNDVKTVIFTSSDKAVNPTNVMGTSKLMGERLITAANSHNHGDSPIFASTRFGNVLGSNGSVVRIFQKQISQGGPLTITNNEMSRFVMSIKQSGQMVLETALLAKGGEVFITKMPVIKIVDLARAMIDELATLYGYNSDTIETQVIGVKPGEKLYEELMSEDETRRSVELRNYFSVLPAFRSIYNNFEYDYEDLLKKNISKAYISSKEAPLSISEIRKLLKECQL